MASEHRNASTAPASENGMRILKRKYFMSMAYTLDLILLHVKEFILVT